MCLKENTAVHSQLPPGCSASYRQKFPSSPSPGFPAVRADIFLPVLMYENNFERPEKLSDTVRGFSWFSNPAIVFLMPEPKPGDLSAESVKDMWSVWSQTVDGTVPPSFL